MANTRVDSKGTPVIVGQRVKVTGTITAIAVTADNPVLTVAIDPTHPLQQSSSSPISVQAREAQVI